MECLLALTMNKILSEETKVFFISDKKTGFFPFFKGC